MKLYLYLFVSLLFTTIIDVNESKSYEERPIIVQPNNCLKIDKTICVLEGTSIIIGYGNDCSCGGSYCIVNRCVDDDDQ